MVSSVISDKKTDSLVHKHGSNLMHDVSPHSQKQSRKKWSVQGEPRALMKRLRSQLAEDGCAESQLLMAVTLLELEDGDHEENCQQGIYWLTQASLQGCMEATEILKTCFANGTGIYDQNYEDVKQCLKMDQEEKLARVAASRLFLSLSAGNDWITSRMLQRKVQEIVSKDFYIPDQKEFETKDGIDLEIKYGGERLSESSLVEASKSFVEGSLPNISLDNILSTQPIYSLANVKRIYVTILIHLYTTFNSIFAYNFKPYHTLLSISLVFILFSYFLQISQLVIVLFYLLFVASFYLMMYSVIALMLYNHELKLFNRWCVVLRYHCDELNTQKALTKFKRTYIPLYLNYFGGLFFYLCILPVIHSSIHSFILPPLLFIFSLLFIAMLRANVLYNFCGSCLYITAHIPVLQYGIKSYLLKVFPMVDYCFHNKYYNILTGLHISLDIGSVFQGLWLVSLAFVALTLGGRNILLHLIGVTWFHAVLGLLQSVEPTFRISVFCIIWGLCLFLPFTLTVVKILFPSVLVFLVTLREDGGLEWPLCITVLSSVSLYVTSHISGRIGSLLRVFVALYCIVSLLHQHYEEKSTDAPLNWDQYQNFCVPSKDTSFARLAKDCAPLKGSVVHWEGTVKQIEVDSTFNIVDYIISFAPNSLHNRLKCVFGDLKPSCTSGDNLCILLKSVKGDYCSVEQWDVTRFKLTVLMESPFWKFSKPTEIMLEVGDALKEGIYQLSVNDKISFVGSLVDGIGAHSPRVRISSFFCAHGSFTTDSHQSLDINYDILLNSLKYAFNFFCGPILTI